MKTFLYCLHWNIMSYTKVPLIIFFIIFRSNVLRCFISKEKQVEKIPVYNLQWINRFESLLIYCVFTLNLSFSFSLFSLSNFLFCSWNSINIPKYIDRHKPAKNKTLRIIRSRITTTVFSWYLFSWSITSWVIFS